MIDDREEVGRRDDLNIARPGRLAAAIQGADDAAVRYPLKHGGNTGFWAIHREFVSGVSALPAPRPRPPPASAPAAAVPPWATARPSGRGTREGGLGGVERADQPGAPRARAAGGAASQPDRSSGPMMPGGNAVPPP
jgi:hypothetical protein